MIKKLYLIIICAALASAFGYVGGSFIKPPEKTIIEKHYVEKEIVRDEGRTFGSSGAYDVFQAAIAGAGMNSTQTTMPLDALTLEDGSSASLTTSTIRFPAYFVVNPRGSNREKIECNAIDSVNNTMINCFRAISCNNITNTTSTIAGGAYAHPAGEPVIMSNDNCFFNRFVDTFTSQNSIAGVKIFTATSVQIGDNTTSTNKRLVFRVGSNEDMYFAINGPTAGNTTGTPVYNVGAGELQLNASGTTVGVEADGGLHLNGGLLGITVSSTLGLATTTNNFLAVIVSSTASENGGFLNFVTTTNGLGRAFWDVRSFLSRAWTIAGNWIHSGTTIFNGNVTTTGTLTANVPTSTRDVANKGYVDSSLVYGGATTTAGFDLNIGQTIYISTTSTAFPTSSSAASSTFAFIGIVTRAASSTQTVTYARPGETVCNQSGLSAGYSYYLNGTLGQIGITPGTKFARIGRAISASCIQLLDPKYIETGSQNITSATTFFQTTGFYPARVAVRAGAAGVGGRIMGISVGDDTNTCVTTVPGNTVTGNAAFDGSLAWKVYHDLDATVRNSGTITGKTSTGFVLSGTTYNSDATVQWVAYSE